MLYSNSEHCVLLLPTRVIYMQRLFCHSVKDEVYCIVIEYEDVLNNEG